MRVPMTLDRDQELELLLADGLASGEQYDAAVASGIDPEEMAALRNLVAESLNPPPLERHRPGAFADAVLTAAGVEGEGLGDAVRSALAPGPTPAIAPAVIAATHPGHAGAPELLRVLDAPDQPGLVASVMGEVTGDPEGVGPVIRSALQSPEGPALAGTVMEVLGIQDGIAALGPALAAGEAPPLADAVMARLAEGESLPGLGGVLAAEAGAPPSLWEGVASRLDLETRGREVEPAGPGSGPGAPVVLLAERRRGWLPLAGIAAAAAAAVLAVIGMPAERASDGHGELAAHIHLESGHADIEEISAGPEAMVQVLQFEDDAPTIIFIDELEAPGGSEGEEGVSL